MNKIFAVTGLAIAFLALTAARRPEPEFSSSARARWTELGFQGPLHLVDPRVDASSILKFRKECRKPVKNVVKAVNAYAYAANLHETGEREKAQKEIKRILNEAGSCANEVGKAYAVSSIAAMSSYGWEYRPGKGRSMVGSMPPHLYFFLLAAFLASEDKLQFGELGSFGERKILGAYSCEDSVIHLDLSLSPLDLASHFVHEIDHLMRDKFPEAEVPGFDEKEHLKLAMNLFEPALGPAKAQEFVAQWEEIKRTRIEPLKDIAPLMMDEALAVLISSSFQVALEDYRLPDDLTLFSREGPLASLWKSLGFDEFQRGLYAFMGDTYGIYRQGSSSAEERIFRDVSLEFLEANFSGLPPFLQRVHADTRGWRTRLRPMPPQVREIHRRVFEAYFPGQPFDERVEHYMNPEFWTREADPLYARYVRIFARMGERLRGHIPTDDAKLPGISFDLSKTVAVTELTLEDLAELRPLLSRESFSCTKFLEAARSGKLAPYIGAATEVHPGGGGIRPGGGGIRPCIQLNETL